MAQNVPKPGASLKGNISYLDSRILDVPSLLPAKIRHWPEGATEKRSTLARGDEDVEASIAVDGDIEALITEALYDSDTAVSECEFD